MLNERLFRRATQVLNHVEYKDWALAVQQMNGTDSPVFLQVIFKATDNDAPDSPQREWQKGYQWLLTPSMSDDDIIRKALQACLAAEEHEAREKFKYRGVAVYSPHHSVEELCCLLNGDFRCG